MYQCMHLSMYNTKLIFDMVISHANYTISSQEPLER